MCRWPVWKVEGRLNQHLLRSTISTKTPAWEYEKEWRYVEESHGLFDYPGTLSQAVFGLRMSDERKNYYKDFISRSIENHVTFFEVWESENLDGLRVQEI